MKGKFLGGTVPLGYKAVNGQLVIDEEKAPIIQYAFKEYAKGAPKKQIINELNARDPHNRNGNPYGASSFQNALRSKKYIGILEQKGIRIENGRPKLIKTPSIKCKYCLIETQDKVQKIKPSLNIYYQVSLLWALWKYYARNIRNRRKRNT